MRADRDRRLKALGLALFALVVLRNAWVSDDAYICLRTVDNFIHGFGLTWNTAERVQGFTCPLWVLVLSGAYAVTHEAFFTTILVSTAMSVAAAGVIVFGVARSMRHAALALLVLTLSKASIDYATSGLENPLGNLVLVLFAAVYLRRPRNFATHVLLGLFAALAAVNRMDTALILAPALAELLVPRPRLRTLGALALGGLPFFAWETFSVVYYGFLFPNTAYAKLGTGIPSGEIWRQGGHYLLDSLAVDPPHADRDRRRGIVVAWRVASPSLWEGSGEGRAREAGSWALAVGAGVVSRVRREGRRGLHERSTFLAAPLVVSVLLIAQTRVPAGVAAWSWPTAFAAAAMLSFLGRRFATPDRAGRPLGAGDARELRPRRGGRSGLLPADRGPLRRRRASSHRARPPRGRRRAAGAPRRAQADRQRERRLLWILWWTGDRNRRPARADESAPGAPPGRAEPELSASGISSSSPEGYLESLAKRREDRLRDRDLGQLFEGLQRIRARLPLFAADRWVAIWKMNTGAYAHLVDQARYRDASPVVRALTDMPAERPEAISASCSRFSRYPGVDVPLRSSEPGAGRRAEPSRSSREHEIQYMDGDEVVGRERLARQAGAAWGALHVFALRTPTEARNRGFTRLRVLPRERIGFLGHVRCARVSSSNLQAGLVRLSIFGAAAIALAASLFIVSTYSRQSHTWDEPTHVVAGLEWLEETGHYTFQ